LCAREKLYISWSAYNDRDNSVKSPSVLVTQLRQYIQDKWSEEFLDSLTTRHPMQPFSLEYFKKDSPLQTYANEWYDIHHQGQINPRSSNGLPVKASPNSTSNQLLKTNEAIQSDVDTASTKPCTLNGLVRCFKNPVKDFFRQILSIDFPDLDVEQYDDESFGLNALEIFQLKDELLEQFSDVIASVDQLQSMIEGHLRGLAVSGLLPLGPMGLLLQESLLSELLPQLAKASELRSLYPVVLPEIEINFTVDAYSLVDEVSNLRVQSNAAEGAVKLHMEVIASRLLGSSGVRTHHLLRPWILSLIFAHLELNVQIAILFSDSHLQITPPSKELADQSLAILTKAYAQSRLSFMPMPLKTAMIYAKDKDIEKAKTAYEGHERSPGEVKDMSFERIYPDFDSLTKDPETLNSWIETFEPFWSWHQIQGKPEHYEVKSLGTLSYEGSEQ